MEEGSLKDDSRSVPWELSPGDRLFACRQGSIEQAVNGYGAALEDVPFDGVYPERSRGAFEGNWMSLTVLEDEALLMTPVRQLSLRCGKPGANRALTTYRNKSLILASGLDGKRSRVLHTGRDFFRSLTNRRASHRTYRSSAF